MVFWSLAFFVFCGTASITQRGGARSTHTHTIVSPRTRMRRTRAGRARQGRPPGQQGPGPVAPNKRQQQQQQQQQHAPPPLYVPTAVELERELHRKINLTEPPPPVREGEEGERSVIRTRACVVAAAACVCVGVVRLWMR